MGSSYRVVTGSTLVPRQSTPSVLVFTRSEWIRLAGLYGVIALLHVVGWGLYLYYSAQHPALVGLGFIAYMFGLRHAFDADHIAAVDDTVTYMLQRGKRPLGIGFFFSLVIRRSCLHSRSASSSRRRWSRTNCRRGKTWAPS